MRVLTSALAALMLVSGVAHALDSGYYAFSKTHKDSTRLHVMWVLDDYAVRNNSAANVNLAALDALYQGVETMKRRLEDLGLEVHVYTFTQLQGDLRLWRFAGSPRINAGLAAPGDGGGYGVAFLPQWWLEGSNTTARLRASAPNGGPEALRRYILPDSTTTHAVFFGGGGHLWRENNAAVHSDSALGLPTNATAGPLFLSVNPYSTAIESAISPLAPTVFGSPADTLWGSYYPYMRSTLTGFAALSEHQFVKYMKHPRGTQSADSVFAPGAAADTLLIGWKLKSSATGKTTDFVIGGDGAMTGSGRKANLDVAWAVLSRYVRVPTVKVAMEIADWFEWGYNPRFRYTRTDPSVRVSAPGVVSRYSWLGNYHQPRPSFMADTVFALLAQYNVRKKVLGTTGDSLKWYMDNSPAWNTMLRRWAADPNIRVFFHDHDKPDTLALPLAGTFGVGQWAADTGHAGSYGVPYSIQRSPFMVRRLLNRNDSLVKALGFTSDKFLLLGADRFMPMGAFDYTNPRLCPAESLMASLVACGYRYVTNFALGEINSAGIAAKRSVQGYEGRVQNAALGLGHRWPLYGSEVYRPVSGGEVRFEMYNAIFASDSVYTGPFMLTSLVASAQDLTYGMLGLYNYSARNIEPATFYGQTTGTGFDRPWGAGRVRVFGWHTEFVQAQPEVGFSPELYAVLAVLKRIRALEAIAGHPLLEWVFPTEAFEAP